MIKIAIMASGEGTIAESLYKESLEHDFFQVERIICDRAGAGIFKRFENYDIDITLIEKNGSNREHEMKILSELIKSDCSWVFLAGYMRILGENFIDHFTKDSQTRIVNIHPSLLPKYPGLAAYERAFESNESSGGVTIHFVDAGIDSGPIIKQIEFPREKPDSLENFIERGKKLEKEIYPQVMTTLLKENTI